MKAIVYQNYGSPDILRCEEIDKPTPGNNEVLIKVRAASVNPLDWKLMKGGPLIVRMLLGLGNALYASLPITKGLPRVPRSRKGVGLDRCDGLPGASQEIGVEPMELRKITQNVPMLRSYFDGHRYCGSPRDCASQPARLGADTNLKYCVYR